jgi:hypothetical protein
MSCPRCDQQGEVVLARILGTGEVISLCDECDATWPEGVEVAAYNFADFANFMAERDLPGVWSEHLASGRDCTADEYVEIAVANNWLVELMNGRLQILTAPTIDHQLIVRSLLNAMDAFVRPRRLGVVLFAPLPLRVDTISFCEPDIILTSARITRIAISSISTVRTW